MVASAWIASASTTQALDTNSNGLDDVWEAVYAAGSLAAAADNDGDGATNAQESVAGTNPFDAASRAELRIAPWSPAQIQLTFARVAGKRYRIDAKTDLLTGTWTSEFSEVAPAGSPVAYLFDAPAGSKFWRLVVDDVDTDADGLSDADERWLRFDPASARTGRSDTTDLQRATSGLNAQNTVTLGLLKTHVTERWPAPGMVVVRRSGGLKPLTVKVAFGGSATAGIDYSATVAGNTNSIPPSTILIPMGVREVPVAINPVSDADDGETSETVTISLQPDVSYTVGAASSASLTIANETPASLPSANAAARFLIQAAFGPDQDSSADADDIPENVEALMASGFEAWIDDQFARPIGYIQPWVDWAALNAGGLGLHGNWKEFSWWSRAMGAPRLRPDAVDTVVPDPLRQRVAFALSEIMVASDRPEALAVEQRGMANFYDLFEQHAFGNYRDLLQAVALHPVMGIYLSHLGNRKADPVARIYPDENFAREIMQLFSIGLWQLNPDGTRQLVNGQPIPTYDNSDITELARVFTGLSFGNNANFQLHPRDFTIPMKGWDAFHDCGPKTLLGGLQLPARAESSGNTGTATMADVSAAVQNLFQHPNVGPFVALRLIQRFVTSNPSAAYVGRVAAKFADNGSGVRGDMKAVIRALLLDPEAREPAMISQPTWGKLREPILANVNVARAFNASSTSGHYPLDQFALAHLQDPMNSPSVFNFFLPTHSPAGPVTQLGLVAPEFQIVNASTAISAANYYWGHILGGLNYWGAGNASYAVRLNLDPELGFMVAAANINDNTPTPRADMDLDALLRRLDLALTGGTLTPENFQFIREAMLRVGTGSWQWHRERLRIAIYLITTSAEFNVLQ